MALLPTLPSRLVRVAVVASAPSVPVALRSGDECEALVLPLVVAAVP